MNEQTMTLIKSLISLFSLVGIGWISIKSKVISKEACGVISAMVVYLAMPATVLFSLSKMSLEGLKAGAMLLTIGFFSYLLFIFISIPLSKLFGVPKGKRGIWQFCATFPNNGFLGFPIILTTFGEEGLALAAVMSIAFNATMFTFGVKQILSDRTGGEKRTKISFREMFLTPVNIATVLGVLLIITGFRLSELVKTPLEYLNHTTTPLSMLMIGMQLAQSKLSVAMRDRSVLLVSATRLVLFPLLLFTILNLFTFDNTLIVPIAITTFAMPTAALAGVFAQEYHINEEFSVNAVFMTSLLSIITIPAMFLICSLAR